MLSYFATKPTSLSSSILHNLNNLLPMTSGRSKAKEEVAQQQQNSQSNNNDTTMSMNMNSKDESLEHEHGDGDHHCAVETETVRPPERSHTGGRAIAHELPPQFDNRISHGTVNGADKADDGSTIEKGEKKQQKELQKKALRTNQVDTHSDHYRSRSTRSSSRSTRESASSSPLPMCSLIKRIYSRCFMIQRLKLYLEQILEQSEGLWDEVVGLEGGSSLSWDHCEQFMELCDEVNPQSKLRTKLNAQITKLVRLENDLMNGMEDVIDVVGQCIRRYRRSLIEQQQQNGRRNGGRGGTCDHYSRELHYLNNQNLQQIVTSESFQNSLRDKFVDIGKLEPRLSDNVVVMNRENSCTSSNMVEDHRTPSSQGSSFFNFLQNRDNDLLRYLGNEELNEDEHFLQLGRRRKIVDHMIEAIGEMVSHVDSSLLNPKKIELEDSHDRLFKLAQKHKKLITAILTSSNSSCSSPNTQDEAPSSDFLY